MEPDFKALAAQDPGSWEGICRLLADISFWWREPAYSGSWLAAARIGDEPVLFWGSFGSCSGCDSLEAADGDDDEVARLIRSVWEGRAVGAEAVVAELERIGNDAWSDGARDAAIAAANTLGMSITLMEVEP